MNFITQIDAIWEEFSMIAKCKSCKIRLTVENVGDFSKLLFHMKNKHSISHRSSLSVNRSLKKDEQDINVETEDAVWIEEKEENEQDYDFVNLNEDIFDTNQISNMTGEIPDKEKRKRKGGGNKSKEEKEANKELKMRKYNLAIEAFKENKFHTYYSCAKKYGVSSSTLKRLVESGKSYVGRGKMNKVLTESEQHLLRDHIKQTSGYSYHDLRLRIQELLHTIVRFGLIYKY